jgi:pimeloyl-ACP methyl ester carboxylesterase
MAAVTPTTRYARSGDYSVAYQVAGDGGPDLIYLPGFASHLEVFWEEPRYSRFLHRMASFSRLILIDRLGTGLSDRLPPGEASTLEQRMDDIRAVLDAVGVERAALLGWSEGAMPCATFAATYPERTNALVMYGGLPRVLSSPEYPWGISAETYDRWTEGLLEVWGQSGEPLRFWAPSVADDGPTRDWFTRWNRLSASPGSAQSLWKALREADVTRILPAISAPTLLIHRTEDTLVPVEWSRFMAREIPEAKIVELPGQDHLWWFGDQDAIVDEVEEFLTGARHAREPDRILATVLFTDIVGSTERAAELGDRRWRELLQGHDSVVRRELGRHRGREVKTTGDGVLATFDGPARAIRCAEAIATGVRPLGIEVRAGLHTGELEVMGDDVGGIAVHTGARVVANAGASEVLVSQTVKDLVAGSGIEFEDRGAHDLKGVPGEWRLFAARS